MDRRIWLAILFALLGSSSFSASAIGDPTAPEILTESAQSQRTKPKILKEALPDYPWSQDFNGSEGWVLLNMSISADGTPHDIVVLDGMGAKVFQELTVKAAGRFTWVPAKVNGQPVDFHNQPMKMTFRRPDDMANLGSSHDAIATAYRQARAYHDDFAGAIAMLKRTLNEEPANLYELSMLELEIASFYARLGDTQEAIRHIRRATTAGFDSIDRRLRETALELWVQFEVSGGHYLEAKSAMALFEKNGRKVKADSPALLELSKFAELISKPNAISVPGVLLPSSLDETKGIWSHRLFRRTIAFDKLTGSFDHFRLACEGKTFDSALNSEQEWTAKEDAGACTLIVFGAPGSTFDLIQSN